MEEMRREDACTCSKVLSAGVPADGEPVLGEPPECLAIGGPPAVLGYSFSVSNDFGALPVELWSC